MKETSVKQSLEKLLMNIVETKQEIKRLSLEKNASNYIRSLK